MLGDFESPVTHELIQRDLDNWCQQIMNGVKHLHELSFALPPPGHQSEESRRNRTANTFLASRAVLRLWRRFGMRSKQIQPRLDRPYIIEQLDLLWSRLWSSNAYCAAIRYMRSLWTTKSPLKIADFCQGHKSQSNSLSNSQRCSGMRLKSQ